MNSCGSFRLLLATLAMAFSMTIASCDRAWTRVSFASGDFSVSVPVAMECGKATQDTSWGAWAGEACGGVVRSPFWRRNGGTTTGTWYHVSWFSVPPEALAADARAVFLDLKKRRALEIVLGRGERRGPPTATQTTGESVSASLGGLPGIEYETTVLEGGDEGQRLILHERLCLRHSRVYTIGMGWAEREGANEANEESWRKFAESFRFGES